MNHEHWMKECLAIAAKGLGFVQPNPMVGSVIVHQDEIVASGFHEHYGAAHAEVNAINAVYEKYGSDAASILQASTLYVNLEPCSHQGKTPPCADRIIQEKIQRVVVANQDPFAAVNGRGIEKLRAAGVEVTVGIMDAEAQFLNKRFFCYHQQQRPYIILKWAESSDGYMGNFHHERIVISGEKAQALNQQWRSEEQAIMVGTRTAMLDNPRLSNRSGKGKNPLRVVIDQKLKIPKTHHLLDGSQKTVVFNDQLTDKVGQTQYVEIDFHGLVPQFAMFQLYLMEIQSVIVEGGAHTIQEFLRYDLWDEIRIIKSKALQLEQGIKAPAATGQLIATQDLESDMVFYYQRI